ncbi:ABC transporter ATP-binding protein [Psychromicrobium lacuslunae]|uniref:ABC transporter ATP-binding protein n=1 Tax=Psychromicrobium lacuslunae TaxID=1618207 RepID=UPI0005D2FFC9|nr:ABC transporter ATP-binding protein [Psychromicrobium lacuslunae]
MNNFPDDEVAIATQGMRCSYGSFEAVKGIDLRIRHGEFFALLGTNGAGKTTTMETLEGHRPATAGTVSVLGADPFRQKAALRPRLGIMLQEAGFADDLTVRETVDLWLRLSSGAGSKQRRQSTTEQSLETLELSSKASVRVKQLSGGQRRRLDLVLATANRPELLFLDEPTTGLDPESRARTWSVIRELHNSGTTVLLTTHYLEEATQLAERLAIMHEGELALTGSVSEVLASEPALLSFSVPSDTSLAELNLGQSVVTEAAELRVSIRTHQLQADLRALLNWADERRLRLDRLNASEASLDEVFRRISSRQSSPDNSALKPSANDLEVAR